MPKSLLAAALQLADVLDRENTALRVMDLARATALLVEKSVAVAHLTAAGEVGSGASDPVLIATARRLDDLALENRRLLERAVVAQQRVIGIIVRAATAAVSEPSYGCSSRQARATGPIALSTRA